jgi:hypothetical protein
MTMTSTKCKESHNNQQKSEQNRNNTIVLTFNEYSRGHNHRHAFIGQVTFEASSHCKTNNDNSESVGRSVSAPVNYDVWGLLKTGTARRTQNSALLVLGGIKQRKSLRTHSRYH